MTLDEAMWIKIDEYPNYSVSNTGEIQNNQTGKIRKLESYIMINMDILPSH